MAEYIAREAVYREICADNTMSGYEIAYCCELIRNIPVTDVAPVVHGRWDGDTCTACKLPWNYNMMQNAEDWGYFDPMPDYCPNCGAKMDFEVMDNGQK